MNKKAKTASGITGIILIFLIGYQIVVKNRLSDDYIFDKDSSIGMADVKGLREPVDFNGLSPAAAGIKVPGNGKPGDATTLDWSGGKGTMVLKYFRFIQSKFNTSTNIISHCEDVRKYLLSVMPKDEAEKVFGMYKKYLDCEIELSKKLSEIGQQPKSIDEILEKLAVVHELRREMLGPEMADALFGAEIKSREYSLRRGAIVADKDMRGEEKEKALASLTSDMWSENAEQVQSIQNPYNRYMEKLEIYKRDLAEMPSDEEKNAKISDIRKQVFPPETVAKLEEVDAKIEADKATENSYREKEKAIMAADMTEQAKQAAIDKLRTDLFGEDKEAFIRREAIRKGSQEAMEKNGRQ